MKEQYKQTHQNTISLVEKMAESLAPLGVSAKLNPEVGLGGGGVGVGFTSPYLTLKLSDSSTGLQTPQGAAVNAYLAQGTTAAKGVANAAAQLLNSKVVEAQPYQAGTLVRATEDSLNINLEALSAALRNNPRLEGMLEKFGETLAGAVVSAHQQQSAPQQSANAAPAKGEWAQKVAEDKTKAQAAGFSIG